MTPTRNTSPHARLVSLAIATLLLPSPGVLAEPDFADNQSTTLTTKAWDALDSQAYDDALAYIERHNQALRLIELYRS